MPQSFHKTAVFLCVESVENKHNFQEHSSRAIMSSVKKEPVDIILKGDEFMEEEEGKDFSEGAENVGERNF